MDKKTVLGIVVSALLIGIWTLTLNIEPVEAWTWPGTIFIRADGSVDPPSAPIQRNGDMYTFTNNIIYPESESECEHVPRIVVERSSITLDGNGYILGGKSLDIMTFVPTGFYLVGINNVTIQNMHVDGFDKGVYIESSSNITVSGSIITGIVGIIVSESSNNTISGNTVNSYARPEDARAIAISESSCNNVSGNNVTFRIHLSMCSFNTISQNNIGYGQLEMSSSSFNTVFGNSIEAGGELEWCLSFGSSSHNIVSGNAITHDRVGIIFSGSSANNTVFENDIDCSRELEYEENGHYDAIVISGSSSDNKFYHNNFFVGDVVCGSSPNAWDDGYPSGGNYWSDYPGVDEYSGANQDEPGHDGIGDTPYVISANNKDNYPFADDPWPNPPWSPASSFVYAPLTQIINEIVTLDASTSCDLDGHIVSYAWDYGDHTNSTEIQPVTTHIYTFPGPYEVTLTVTDDDGLNDTITKPINIEKVGSTISVSASQSTMFAGFNVNITGTLNDMYGNSLKDETVVLHYTFAGINSWVPITSDTTDNRGNYQGIWVPPGTGYFVIKAEWAGNATHSETGNTTMVSSITYENQYVFTAESNSTISDLTFDQNRGKLSFRVSGANDTTGYTRVTIAKNLLLDVTKIKVHIDGLEYNYTVTELNDSWALLFTYNHSAHQVEVDLQAAIPEFPSMLAWLVLAFATTIVAISRVKRKLILE